MHLAYSLIMKKMKNLKGKDLLNTDGQNMLHVLALNSNGTSTNEHIEVWLKICKNLTVLSSFTFVEIIVGRSRNACLLNMHCIPVCPIIIDKRRKQEKMKCLKL